MILLRGFFRKKTTTIYIIVFSILLVSIISLFSFINYYHQLANNIFKETAYVVVASKNDYYNKFTKYQNVTNVKKALLFEPDYDYDILGREGYVITKSDGTLIDSRPSEEKIRINWEDFFADGGATLDKSILIFSSNKLADNQIALGLASDIMHRSNYFYKDINDIISDLIGHKIGFYIGKNKSEFVIDSVYESYFSEMTISDNTFKELSKKSNLHVYKLTINDYDKAVSITEKIKGLEKNIIVSLNEKQPETTNGLGIENLKDLINILTFVSYVIIFVFSTIFLVVTKNIIRDEQKNINIERLLGFNKKQTRKYLIMKEIVLNTFAFFVATNISIILNILLNNCVNIKLTLFNPILLLKIYIMILFIALLFCFFCSIRQNRVLKNY